MDTYQVIVHLLAIFGLISFVLLFAGWLGDRYFPWKLKREARPQHVVDVEVKTSLPNEKRDIPLWRCSVCDRIGTKREMERHFTESGHRARGSGAVKL